MCIRHQFNCQDAPVVFVQAQQLPKQARIEWQVRVHTGRDATEGPSEGSDDGDDGTADSIKPVHKTGECDMLCFEFPQ